METLRIPLYKRQKGTKEHIPTGDYALVLDIDYPNLNQYHWFLHSDGYAYRPSWVNGKYAIVFMHREVNQTPEGLLTDHVNGNKLDNQRTNLRSVTPSQNQRNRKINCNNQSGYKGVYWRSDLRKWAAKACYEGKVYRLGYFHEKEAARSAYEAFHREQQRVGTIAKPKRENPFQQLSLCLTS